MPLYLQLRESIRELITSGTLLPGDRLPGEHDLCLTYGVSRTVVRQALSDLQRENVLDKRRGSGTFVAHARTAQGLVQSLGGLFDDVRALGRSVRSEVKRQTVEAAGPVIAERLGVSDQTPVIVLERLRYVDDEPWVFTTSHLPFDVAPDLLGLDMRTQSLYALLREKYGHELTAALRTVEAFRSDPHMAHDLGVHPGDPLLKLTCITYGSDGRAIETFVAFHRADRTKFEVFLTRPDHGKPGSIRHDLYRKPLPPQENAHE